MKSPSGSLRLFTCLVLSGAFLVPGASLWASESPLSAADQKQLANDFLARMKAGFGKADDFMRRAKIENDVLNLRGLPPGEILVFELMIPPRLKVEGTVLGEVGNNTVLLSFADFLQALEFPIQQDAETGVFSGWFIRETKTFSFDPKTGAVTADGQAFQPSGKIVDRDGDIMVPLEDLKTWFAMDMDLDVSVQRLTLDPTYPLPATERAERRKNKFGQARLGPPELPRGNDEYSLLKFPSVDVNTRTTVRDRADQEREIEQFANVRTAGEFAYGTLNTNINGTREDKVTNVRASYLRESAYPELLGPLKARRFEAGDIGPTRQPLIGSAGPETGLRITNADPLVRQTGASTQIAGYINPGWDVELFRENSLISFQETGPDGYYSFDDVPLFSDRNEFRVVAYGPQGEIVEEIVSVPYDRERLAQDGGIYDVSVTMQDRQLYEKFDPTTEDENTPHVSAFYETAISENSAVRAGVRARQEEGVQKTYGNLGLSTTLAGALLNAGVASDEKGEMGSELVASRLFGQHRTRAALNFNTDGYDPGGGSTNVKVFSNTYNVEGPLPFGPGQRPRYAASAGYTKDSSGTTSLNGFLNFNTQFKNIGLNQILNYTDNSNSVLGAEIDTLSSISGSFGKNIFRGTANYNIQPDSQLESLAASWRRRFSNQFESQLQVDQQLENSLTRYSAQVNWRPDHATISPRLTYDSEGNLEGMLSTSFGVTRVPGSGEFVMSNTPYTSSGLINGFVYLDKNGNRVFDEGEDEPIPDAKIRAPHNSSGGTTNEDGLATISQLRPNVVTDVFVEPGSLADPYWIPADKGVSIMPRTGTNVALDFPVHMAGEMDGTVYAKSANGSSKALRNVIVRLYDSAGKEVMNSVTSSDGFYIFSLIPPGQYSLLVDEASVPKDVARPLPQTVIIGYEGTIIYGNDIVLNAENADIPSDILASLDDYKALHPHIDFSLDPSIVLNLGEYKSSLTMAMAWYRLSSRYEPMLRGSTLLVPPSESYADPKTGLHQLRVALDNGTIEDAYARCRALVSRQIFCKVEILPGALPKQQALPGQAVSSEVEKS